MKEMKLKQLSLICMIGLVFISLVGCRVPADEIIVVEEESESEGIEFFIPEYTDWSGVFMSRVMGPYFFIVSQNSQSHNLDVSKVPFFDSNWTENERVWSNNYIIENKPDFISLAWNMVSVDKDKLLDLKTQDDFDEEIYDRVPELTNPYIVPLGVYMNNYQIRKSELMRVFNDDEMEELKGLSLLEILDKYYEKNDSNRNLSPGDLLDIASENDPLALPTLARIHHKRLNEEDTKKLVKKAFELKDKWNIDFSNKEGVLTGQMSSNGLNSDEVHDLKENELYVLRPSFADPIVYGVATSAGREDTYVFEKFVSSMLEDKGQKSLYLLSKSDLYGACFSPVIKGFYENTPVEDERLDYGVKTARRFYMDWLENGPWEPALMYQEKTYDQFGRLNKLIYRTLESESPDWEAFEKQVKEILNDGA